MEFERGQAIKKIRKRKCQVSLPWYKLMFSSWIEDADTEGTCAMRSTDIGSSFIRHHRRKSDDAAHGRRPQPVRQVRQPEQASRRHRRRQAGRPSTVVGAD